MASFNTPLSGTIGGSSNPIVIDAGRTVGGINFGTSSGTYVIGSTSGNSLYLSNGGTIQTLSGAGTSAETINAKLVIVGANATYTLTSGYSSSGSTLTLGGTISAGTAGNTVLTLNGANTGANTISGPIIDGSGTMSIVKSGAGVWALSGTNTFSGGVTLNAGTLNINSATALGTGTFTINGGGINNGSGVSVNSTTNNAMVWNGNFAWGGTGAVNMGNGLVQLNLPNVVLTASGTSALTIGGTIEGYQGNLGYSFTKAGTGLVVISGDQSNNGYDSGTYITGGVLEFLNSDKNIAGTGNTVGSPGSGSGLGGVLVGYGGAAAFGYSPTQTTLGRIVVSSQGVLALTGTVSNSLDFNAAGFTSLNLGALGSATYAGVLTPDNSVYRLGGAGGTLELSNALSGSNSVVIGGGGSGGVVTYDSAGTYTGTTTVMAPTYNAFNSEYSNAYGVANGGSILQTNITNSTTPFGSGPIVLNGGELGLGTAGSGLTATGSINVTGYNVTFSGRDVIALKVGAGASVTFAANSLNRATGGVLMIDPTSSTTLGTTEKVTVATGAPTVVNGMVAPYYVDGTTGNFLTYGANGFTEITGQSGTFTGAGPTTNISMAQNGNISTPTWGGILTINSLRFNGTDQYNDTATLGASTDILNIQSGGFIIIKTGAALSLSGATLNFGTNEAVIGMFGGGLSLNQQVLGSGGATFYGNSVTINNLNVTGGINIASGILTVGANQQISNNVNNILTIGPTGELTWGGNGRVAQFLGLQGSGKVSYDSATNGANTGTGVLIIDGMATTATSVYNGLITDGGSSSYNVTLSKYGLNTQVLTFANTYTGTTTLGGGTLRLDFTAAGAPVSNIINNSANNSPLALSGNGNLNIVGTSANSQQFAALSLGAGSSTISLTSSDGSSNPTLTFTNANTVFTRAAGSSLNIVDPANGSVSFSGSPSLVDSNGVWVLSSASPTAFATVNGNDWASANSGIISELSSYNANSFTSTDNTDVTSSGTSAPAAFTDNTLRFNTTGGTTLTLSGSNTVATGGILIGSNTLGAGNAATMTGGTIVSGTGKETVIIDNGQLKLNSVLGNSASGATAVTYSGTGTTTLLAANTYTGSTYLDSGTVIVGAASNAFGSTSGTLNLNGGAVQSSAATTIGNVVSFNNFTTITGTSNLTFSNTFYNNARAGTVLAVNNPLLTFTGTLNLGGTTYGYGVNDPNAMTFGGSGNVLASGAIVNGALNYNGTGDMTISGSTNSYYGSTIVSSGTLSVSNLTNGALAMAATSTAASTTLTVTSTVGLSVGQYVSGSYMGVGAKITSISSTGTQVTLSVAAGSTGSSTVDFGAGSAIGNSSNAAGNIVLNGGTFQYTGADVSTDRLFSVGSSGGALDASGSGTVTFTNTGAIGFYNQDGARTLTLTGTNTGPNTLNAVIGDAYSLSSNATSLVKSGVGTWVLGGANTYSGGTTIASGTLVVANTAGSGTGVGALTVNSGATLAGKGTINSTSNTINGNVTVGSGGTNTTDVLTMTATGTTTITNATLAFNLDSTTTHSNTLAVGASNAVVFGTGDTLSLNIQGATVVANSTMYELFNSTVTGSGVGNSIFGGSGISYNSGTGVISGLTLNIASSQSAGYYSNSYLKLVVDGTGYDIDLDVQGVPEPSTWALLLGGVALLIVFHRARRAKE